MRPRCVGVRVSVPRDQSKLGEQALSAVLLSSVAIRVVALDRAQQVQEQEEESQTPIRESGPAAATASSTPAPGNRSVPLPHETVPREKRTKKSRPKRVSPGPAKCGQRDGGEDACHVAHGQPQKKQYDTKGEQLLLLPMWLNPKTSCQQPFCYGDSSRRTEKIGNRWWYDAQKNTEGPRE
mmetsp:Transcript_79946/g.166216  ORF Transcript_79946/g.166216 Transcript_79946/m.166216 type:complete len:181 (-) Transcript_79946:491-1033(-)